MYKYNSNINYQPNGGYWHGLTLDLYKQKIYVNELQYIDIAFENILKEYAITSEDKWKLPIEMIIMLFHRPPHLRIFHVLSMPAKFFNSLCDYSFRYIINAWK